MALALELFIIPLLLIAFVVVSAIAADFSVGAALAVAVGVGIPVFAVFWLLRLEHEEDLEAERGRSEGSRRP